MNLFEDDAIPAASLTTYDKGTQIVYNRFAGIHVKDHYSGPRVSILSTGELEDDQLRERLGLAPETAIGGWIRLSGKASCFYRDFPVGRSGRKELVSLCKRLGTMAPLEKVPRTHWRRTFSTGLLGDIGWGTLRVVGFLGDVLSEIEWSTFVDWP